MSRSAIAGLGREGPRTTLTDSTGAEAVRKKSLALSEKLYSDNQKQVEIGTLAPIAIVQAEAEVAARQQDLLTAETNVLQQETIIKNTLKEFGANKPGTVYFDPTTDHLFELFSAPDSAYFIAERLCETWYNSWEE